MRITHSSQWLIGEDQSDYLFLFSNPEDGNLEFKLDSDEYSFMDFRTNLKGASIRYDDSGSRFENDYGTNFQNVQIVSDEDIGFYVQDQDSLFIGSDGNVDISIQSTK